MHQPASIFTSLNSRKIQIWTWPDLWVNRLKQVIRPEYLWFYSYGLLKDIFLCHAWNYYLCLQAHEEAHHVMTWWAITMFSKIVSVLMESLEVQKLFEIRYIWSTQSTVVCQRGRGVVDFYVRGRCGRECQTKHCRRNRYPYVLFCLRCDTR